MNCGSYLVALARGERVAKPTPNDRGALSPRWRITLRRIRTRLVTGLVVGVIVATTIFGSTSSADTTVTTNNGTWTAHPGSASLNQTAVQQPINADGTSNFKGGKGVIPVKFSLSQGTGPFVFQSIFSDNTPPNPNTANDYSFLSWRSATPLTFADITRLSAIYAFTDGDCAGGSLRWSVRLNDGGTNRNLDIHYQPGAGGIGQQTCAPGTSGANLIGSTDTPST